jgi:hypothetical protein
LTPLAGAVKPCRQVLVSSRSEISSFFDLEKGNRAEVGEHVIPEPASRQNVAFLGSGAVAVVYVARDISCTYYYWTGTVDRKKERNEAK